MILEEALPALRQGAMLSVPLGKEMLYVKIVNGKLLAISSYDAPSSDDAFENMVENEHGDENLHVTPVILTDTHWSVILPARAKGYADTDSREPSTADRPVPGYGGYVLDIQDHDVFTSEGRSFLDNLGGPEIAQIDGRWLYVDPSLPKVNG